MQACGVLMFPTKALAQDQLRVLRQLMNDAFGQQAPCVEVSGVGDYVSDVQKASDIRFVCL